MSFLCVGICEKMLQKVAISVPTSFHEQHYLSSESWTSPWLFPLHETISPFSHFDVISVDTSLSQTSVHVYSIMYSNVVLNILYEKYIWPARSPKVFHTSKTILAENHNENRWKWESNFKFIELWYHWITNYNISLKADKTMLWGYASNSLKWEGVCYICIT